MEVFAPLAVWDDGGRRGQEDGEESADGCGGMAVAPVARPGLFYRSLKEASGLKRLFDFHKGTTTLGFVFQGGILLACDSRASMGSFISSEVVRKIIEINRFLLGTMAGGAADCSFWERHLARLCRLYELRNRERMPVAAAATTLANIMYGYRGYGLVCGTMIAGWDERLGPQLFYVDSDGAKIENRLFSVGSGSTYAYGVLDSSYRHDMSLEEATELGLRAIYHATHRDGASGGVARVYHIHREGWTKIEEGKDVTALHFKYAAEKGVDGLDV